ncbi:unnamed protein product [Cuscuta epithymum]|uniref:Uncharacterized protein n=1 Tax=Cuscuta epithymum TaxID=186058 RepID=A0AAV0G1F5_9ASTE|nr:unnamed protein product [Cuscuta epithymum]
MSALAPVHPRSKITLGTIGEHQKWKEGPKSQDKNKDPEFLCCTRSGTTYTRSGTLLKNQIGSNPGTRHHARRFLTTLGCHARSGDRQTRSGMSQFSGFREAL